MVTLLYIYEYIQQRTNQSIINSFFLFDVRKWCQVLICLNVLSSIYTLIRTAGLCKSPNHPTTHQCEKPNPKPCASKPTWQFNIRRQFVYTHIHTPKVIYTLNTYKVVLWCPSFTAVKSCIHSLHIYLPFRPCKTSPKKQTSTKYIMVGNAQIYIYIHTHIHIYTYIYYFHTRTQTLYITYNHLYRIFL